ncbi:hypothetical protein [Corynebacterium sp. TAE3-ERU16]|uniref:hypothetical protein n=1 Tax=Corynebacterium sp. TAE3-ERU16 TaxID=2849493 RepID=UPI001C457E95|nr:hypothetical protein [Corynebacterium sp. TAE3-ERU16]MBV7292341.1 hypothetical protein [Corynebacterium sp. TAE3-ERU16]
MPSDLTGIRALIRAKYRAQRLTMWGHTAVAAGAGFSAGTILTGHPNNTALTAAAMFTLAALCAASAFYTRADRIRRAIKRHEMAEAKRRHPAGGRR